MNITNIKIKEQDFDKLKGIASITLDNELILTGIKILQGPKELFVGMPSVMGKEGEIDSFTQKQKYYDTFYPCSSAARNQLTEAVLAKFNESARLEDKAGITNADTVDSGFVTIDNFDDSSLPF